MPARPASVRPTAVPAVSRSAATPTTMPPTSSAGSASARRSSARESMAAPYRRRPSRGRLPCADVRRSIRPVPALAVAGLLVVLAGCLGGGASGGSVADGAVPPPDRSQVPAAVWAVGDGDSTAAGTALARRIAASRPDRFLYLGDVYDAGSARDFRRNYAPAYGRLARVTAPTPGNHDWAARVRGYDPYWQEGTGERIPPWYAFTVG